MRTAVYGKIEAARAEMLALLDDGPLIVSNVRRYDGVFGGTIPWSAAKQLIAAGMAVALKTETVRIRRGPRNTQGRVRLDLTLMKPKADAI